MCVSAAPRGTRRRNEQHTEESAGDSERPLQTLVRRRRDGLATSLPWQLAAPGARVVNAVHAGATVIAMVPNDEKDVTQNHQRNETDPKSKIIAEKGEP